MYTLKKIIEIEEIKLKEKKEILADAIKTVKLIDY